MRLAGIVLGVGLGGFVDGITLHQIMQWHNMGAAVLPPTTIDAMAQVLIGQMILGWGLFNLVQGPIDHHLLNIHHVRAMPFHVSAYDWIFLAVGGVGFSLIGLLLARGTRELPPTRA